MTDDAAAAAELLAKKKRSRTGHRGSATRILDQVTTALGADTIDTDRLSTLKVILDEKLEILKRLDEEVAELVPDDELEAEITRSDENRERIYTILTKINRALQPAPLISTTASAATAATARTPTADPSSKVKLPRITLPRFNGDMMKWTSFWDSYNSAVHSSTQLSDIEKFNYLKSLLEQSAHDAIAGLSLSAANYPAAVEVLKKRFGNKQLIISRHMESLLSVNAITSDHHLRDLRRLYDKSEANIRSLKALGVEPASYGAMLSSVLLTKLPPEIRLIVSRKVATDDLDLESILRTFEAELVARERASTSTSSIPPQRQSSHGRPSTSALLTGTQAAPNCAFCQRSHYSSDCTVVTDVEARKKALMNSGRCFNCLRKGHRLRDCPSGSKCRRCHGKHHTSICTRAVPPSETPSLPAERQTPLNPGAPAYKPSPNTTSTTSTLCSTEKKAVLLQTACAVVHNPMKPEVALRVRILLDSGSQRSYLTDRAMKLLQLAPKGEQTLSIAAFGAVKEQTRVCPVVELGLRVKGYPTLTLSLFSVPTICEPLSCQPVTACVEANTHLSGLDLADSSEGNTQLPVDLLIGCDHYWDLVTGSICRGEKGPTAIHTKLGWVLSGPTLFSDLALRCATTCSTTHLLQVDCQTVVSAQLDQQLKSFWELESLGINQEETTLYDDFADRIVLQNGRYTVPLPWKEFHESLPDNYALSRKRLESLLHRLKHDPSLLKEYDDTIQDQANKGIIELVPPEETTPVKVHYLPHHAVVRRDKATTKLRVVYDASARSTGPSLNECLHKGPKFQQLILDLLIRFRSYRVALIADIEKAFLVIGVDEKDRDVLRFIWIDDVTKEEPKVIVYRFTRVVFGVSSSPFLLNATVRYHLERFLESDETIVRRLLQSAYVDDIISGAHSEEAAFMLYTKAKEILRQGGFNLRKFLSNSKSLQARIDAAEKSSDADTSTNGVKPVTRGEIKVLGVTWDPDSDTLISNISDIADAAHNLQPTKRNVVSLIGRFFDPLGFLAPVVIKFKVLFQKLSQSKLDWDSESAGDLLREWRLLLTDLREAVPISIPRSYEHHVKGDVLSYTLCGFCDASTRAYAAVVYLVLKSDAHTEVKFVVSKTRVAPLRSQTIPRLELLSAFLLSKLITSVIDSLSPTLAELSVKCYTDSQVSLFWIRGNMKEWKPFVNNRVREIRNRVQADRWAHCPGLSNPADLPSRGLSPLELSVSRLWRQGPEWLQASFEPLAPEPELPMPSACAMELKASQSHSLVVSRSSGDISLILEPTRYSTFSKLIGVTAAVLQAVRRFKDLAGKTTSAVSSAKERQNAEILWVQSAQSTLTDFETLTKHFNLFKDDQVWRCRGRLENSEMPYAAKFPILLPKSHPITSLIVKRAHERVLHDGVGETLTEVGRVTGYRRGGVLLER